MSEIYNVIAGSFVRKTNIIHEVYSDKDEAIKDLLYRVHQYNEIVTDINENTKNDYRELMIKTDNKKNEILRYESDVDYVAIRVE